MKLRLKNFKGIKAGPELTWDGLDEIEIDYTGKHGLTAFEGINGIGKSTVLESMHHYPQLVSRDSALWQNVLGRKAEKEFESDFMGNHYRSLIKMDADQGKMEGFMWVNGASVVNGKITAYKEYVNSVFGKPFTYFRSQFCPQKSRKTKDMQIENMTAGVFQELLQEFLNIRKYAVYEGTAKQCGNVLAGKVAGLETRLSTLQTQVAKKGEIEEQRFGLGDKLAGMVDNQTILRHELEEKKKEVEALKETVAKNSVLLAQRDDLQRTIDRMTKDMAKEQEAVEGELNGLRAKHREMAEALKRVNDQLANRDEILAADQKVKEAERQIDELMPIIDEISREIEKKQAEINGFQDETAALRTKLAEIKAQIKDPNRDPEIVKMRAELSHLRSRAVELDKKDPTCKSTTCSFIKGALEAAQKAPALYAEINAMAATLTREAEKAQREFDELQRQITEKESKLHDQMKDLKAGREVLAAKMAIVRPLRESLPKLREKALLASEIIKGEQIKTDLEARIAEIKEADIQKRKAWAIRETSLHNAINAEQEKYEAVIIDEDAGTKLLTVEAEIKKIETAALPDLEKKIQGLRDEVAKLKGDLERIDEAGKELVAVRAERDELTRKMSRWSYLQAACSKTGIPNIRIDGAAPNIVYNANRLLMQAYNAMYSIRLETINDNGKEDLKIKIIIADGREIYLDDISGGQRTWCVQSLWLAMSILNQQKSGKHYPYFCADESDGALDPENAENFTALYRPFMGEASLEDLFFISHRPECRNMADHVLSFEHGKNPAWR